MFRFYGSYKFIILELFECFPPVGLVYFYKTDIFQISQ